MLTAENKAKLNAAIDKQVDTRVIKSVLAAGAVLAVSIFALRKFGLGKVANVVAKVK